MYEKYLRHYENDYFQSVRSEKSITIDEAMFFAVELAFKDRIKGLTEIEFLKRFDLTENEYVYNNYINWGIAVTIVAKHFYLGNSHFNSELN